MMYNLTEISDRIWLVEFDSHYNLSMTFLRYQEYYESPNENFFRTPFLIKEYVEWYSSGSEFTYHLDWAGFNIPSNFIIECQSNIPDMNEWDSIMSDIVDKIREKSGDLFYLIGIKDGDNDVLKHEVAHGLFYINDSYNSEMMDLYRDLPNSIRERIHSYLIDTGGYSEGVFIDETQSYMATGLPGLLIKQNDIRLESIKFNKVFDKYYKLL